MLNFHEVQDSLVSHCYNQLCLFLWPRYKLNQSIWSTWKMKKIVSSFQNVQELSIWVHITQDMNLTRWHDGVMFHTISAWFRHRILISKDQKGYDALKYQDQTLILELRRSDGYFIPLTHSIQCKSKKESKKSTLPLLPFLSHMTLNCSIKRAWFHLIFVA